MSKHDNDIGDDVDDNDCDDDTNGGDDDISILFNASLSDSSKDDSLAFIVNIKCS